MHIDNGRSERTGTAGEENCSDTAQPALRAIQRVGALEPADPIEIAGAGRARALSHLADAGRGARLTPRRVAELRERIASGFYDTPEVLDRMARRILESGELGRKCGEEDG